MRLSFLTPSVDLIRADGSIQALHPGGSLGRLRPRLYLLARELCAFQMFEAGSLPQGRRRQAAILFARTASPYVSSGVFLSKAGPDFGVWWWDRDRLAQLMPGLAPNALLRPESLAQPSGEGWRIVRLSHGFEAQLWINKTLRASSWRRDAFDAAAWSAFVRLQRGDLDAPAAPPAPVVLPIAEDSPAVSAGSLELTPRQAAIMAGSATVVAVVFSSLFLLGQGLGLAQDRRAVEAETEQLRAATPAASQSAELQEARRVLAAYAEIERRTNPLTATGAALGALALHEIEPSRMEADEESLTVTLPYASLEAIDDIVAELEGSGYFTEVEPQTDVGAQSLTITMKVRADAPPLG
jgi:hypothetical protein